jgi:thioredoxin reductase (NADPH)
MYDVIIIGKGPAGISAALYTHRANLKTLIIGKNNSSILKAHAIENYYGLPKISGEELINIGINQAKDLGIEIIDKEVISISMEDTFNIITENENYKAKTVLLATGQPYNKLKIINIDIFEGKGISYCTTCDGFFYKGLKVGVLGYNDFTIHEANELKAFTNNITIYTNGNKLQLSDKYSEDIKEYKVNEDKIKSFNGGEFLDSITYDDDRTEEINGMFIAFGSASSADFAKKLGILTDNDKKSIKIDKNYMTNLEGIFAAGDCIGGFKQIATAVGEGSLAAKGIIKYVREK